MRSLWKTWMLYVIWSSFLASHVSFLCLNVFVHWSKLHNIGMCFVWFCGQIHQTSPIRVILVVLWSFCQIQSSNFWWFQFNCNFTNEGLPLNWFLKILMAKKTLSISPIHLLNISILNTNVSSVGGKKLITKDVFHQTSNKIKKECEGAT